jgi:hypothetical protein
MAVGVKERACKGRKRGSSSTIKMRVGIPWCLMAPHGMEHAGIHTPRLGKDRVRPERLAGRLRSNPRVIKRKMSNWPVKRPEHRDPPKPSKPPSAAITVLAA